MKIFTFTFRDNDFGWLLREAVEYIFYHGSHDLVDDEILKKFIVDYVVMMNNLHCWKLNRTTEELEATRKYLMDNFKMNRYNTVDDAIASFNGDGNGEFVIIDANFITPKVWTM